MVYTSYYTCMCVQYVFIIHAAEAAHARVDQPNQATLDSVGKKGASTRRRKFERLGWVKNLHTRYTSIDRQTLRTRACTKTKLYQMCSFNSVPIHMLSHWRVLRSGLLTVSCSLFIRAPSTSLDAKIAEFRRTHEG